MIEIVEARRESALSRPALSARGANISNTPHRGSWDRPDILTHDGSLDGWRPS